MSGIHPRLVEVAVQALRGMQSLAQTEGWRWDDNEIIAQTVLECFEVREEFRAVTDDLSDFRTETFDDPKVLMENYPNPYALEQRWLLRTDWRRVEAHIEWEPT